MLNQFNYQEECFNDQSSTNLQKKMQILQKKVKKVEENNKLLFFMTIILTFVLLYFEYLRQINHNIQIKEIQKLNYANKQAFKINMPINQQDSNINKQIQDLRTQITEIDQSLEFLFNIQRKETYNIRLKALNQSKIHKNFESTNVTKFMQLQALNFNLPFTGQVYQKKQNIKFENISKAQYIRYDQKYNISQVTTQLPFCVIIPTWNNAANYRYQLNLRSILIQNYTNYKVHIIDDASNDQTYFLLKRFLRINNISSQKVTLERVIQRSFMLKNIIYTARKYCNKQQIVAVIDGDDELIGVNTFKLFNSFYSRQKLGVVYSNNVKYYNIKHILRKGYSKPFPNWAIKKNLYRKVGYIHSQLRTYQAQLLFSIKDKDLRQQDGQYFQYGSDNAIMYPIQEMSCGKIKYLNQINYFVNSQTYNNDYQKGKQKQAHTQSYINKMQKYTCKQNYK